MTEELDQIVNGLDEIKEEEVEDQDNITDVTDDEPEEDEQDKPVDPYRGKSREQVIKELESTKAQQETLKNEYITKLEQLKVAPMPTVQQQEEAKDILKELGLSEKEIEGMTATEIVKVMGERLPKLTEQRIQEILRDRDTARDNAGKQIQIAKEKYPALSNDTKYRSVVKLVLESARRGQEQINLDQACQRANQILQVDGQVSPEVRQVQQKKSKAVVETGSGAPVSPRQSDSEEDRIRKLLGDSSGAALPGLT